MVFLPSSGKKDHLRLLMVTWQCRLGVSPKANLKQDLDPTVLFCIPPRGLKPTMDGYTSLQRWSVLWEVNLGLPSNKSCKIQAVTEAVFSEVLVFVAHEAGRNLKNGLYCHVWLRFNYVTGRWGMLLVVMCHTQLTNLTRKRVVKLFLWTWEFGRREQPT